MASASEPTGRAFRLRAARLQAAGSLLLERVWPPIFFLVCLSGLFLAFAWFGLFAGLPGLLRLTLIALFAVGALLVLWRYRDIRLPRGAEIVARLERESHLAHQALAVQDEQPIGQDPLALALFAAHQRRMAERLRNLRGGRPNARTERLDPLGLRALLAMLVATAFAFSHGPGGGRISDAFAPVEGTVLAAARVDAWVTPPGYTGRAPVFLSAGTEGDAAHPVPEGSILSVRVSENSGAALSFLSRAGEDRRVAPAGAQGGEAAPSGPLEWELALNESGTAELETRLRTLGAWSFTVVPDLAPLIEFDGEPRQARNGALEFSYRIVDDYGAVSGSAEIRVPGAASDARPIVEAPEIRLAMPRRTRGEARGRTSTNLVESPYAGSEVALTLQATDDAGQTGRSEPRTLTLPERAFTNPLARAIVEQRRILALDANAAPRVVRMLDAVTLRGDEFIERTGDLLALRVARSRIASAASDADLVWAVDFLWQVALGVEDGDLSLAEQRLREAQEALSEALEEGAPEEEIAALMDELRAAMQEYMQAMAEAMQNRPPQSQSEMGDVQEIRPQDLERMLDRIEDLARSGSPDAARQLLAEMQEMMDNLQSMQAQGQQQQGGEESQARRTMDELVDVLQNQQALRDRTFDLGREQMRRQMGENGMPGGPEGPAMSDEDSAEALEALEADQRALQQELDTVRQGLRELGLESGDNLADADAAMDQAGEALAQGRDGEALERQGEAIEALRSAAQEAMSQMQAQGQGNQPQGGQGQGYGPGQQSSGRDPLGRERQQPGTDFGQDVGVPDEIDVQRARRILDQIRERLGDRLSPELERDYLERLLRTP